MVSNATSPSSIKCTQTGFLILALQPLLSTNHHFPHLSFHCLNPPLSILVPLGDTAAEFSRTNPQFYLSLSYIQQGFSPYTGSVSKTCNSQYLSRLKLAIRNSTQVPHVGGRNPSTWASICCFPGILATSWARSTEQPELKADISIWGAGVPDGSLIQ